MHTRAIPDGGRTTTTFEDVVRIIGEAPYWEFVDGSDAEDAAARARRTGDPSLRFDQRGTDNRLAVTYREAGTVASDLSLHTVLDSGFETNTGPFLTRLARTHETIAEKYATTHVHPQRDTSVAATGTLPAGLDTLQIRTAVCAVSAIGFEIGRLHDSVREPLEEYSTAGGGPDHDE